MCLQPIVTDSLISDRDAANTAEYYILKHEEMVAAEYPIPTFLDSTVTLSEGWHETRPGKENQKKKLVAVDCEMVKYLSDYVELPQHCTNPRNSAKQHLVWH
jgi:hypothetical protein